MLPDRIKVVMKEFGPRVIECGTDTTFIELS